MLRTANIKLETKGQDTSHGGGCVWQMHSELPLAERQPRDATGAQMPDWRVVDRALRTIAARRAALDAEEADWLRKAEALQIWRQLGMVSALDYLERTLGYAPRTAQERLRVARALGDLPRLTAALAGGELPFSAIRELTRVATRATEADWAAAVQGMNLRQVEELVANHQPGDRPGDPPSPVVRNQVVRFELEAETFSLLRQTRQVLDHENGTNLSDDALITRMCSAVLEGVPGAEHTGRAKYQIAMIVCERCGQGWQEGAGVQVPVGRVVVERALCDAQHIGSIDGDAPERAYQDISPAVARFVRRRDGGRCRVDGCRSARELELHHIVHRADGGTHDASNIILCCGSCHRAHHEGRLRISGNAERLEVHRLAHGDAVPAQDASVHVGAWDATDRRAHDAVPAQDAGAHVGASDAADRGAREAVPAQDAGVHATSTASARDTRPRVVAPSRLDVAMLRTRAKAALVGMGWSSAIAAAAVTTAITETDTTTIERLVFESLRRCPIPGA